MAKKTCNGEFACLIQYFRSIQHPIFVAKPSPSHKELLEITAQHFNISLKGSKKGMARKAVALLPLPQNHPAKKKQQKPVATIGKSHGFSVDFIISDAFLESYEWRKLRYSILKDHGGTCSLCGRGRPNGAILNVDHIKPRRKYPDLALDADNLQVLCHDCNHGKGNWDMTDWR